jgi:hypothetical protein
MIKTVFAVAISTFAIYAAAATTGTLNTLSNVNTVNVTGANGGQDGGQDQNREELSVAVVDNAGPVTGAKCTLSNDKGDWSVTAPDTVTVRRSKSDLKIECVKPGYNPAEGVLQASTTQITPKHFEFGTDAGGDGSDDERPLITVPQYAPAITVTLNGKPAAAQ